MTAKITGENKKIIKIGYCKIILGFLQTLLYEPLKWSRSIHDFRRYPYPLLKTGDDLQN